NLSVAHHINGKKVMVTNQILLEHYSPGNFDEEWIDKLETFHQLYQEYLPIIKAKNLTRAEYKKLEFETGKWFINRLIIGKEKRKAIFWWSKIIRFNFFDYYHLVFLKNWFRLSLKK